MFWKKENKTEKRLDQINDILKKSFSNVKKDTNSIFQWLNYFYRKNLEQEQTIKSLQMELSYAPKTSGDIRRIVDNYYSFENMIGQIRELNDRVAELERVQPIQAEGLISQPITEEPRIVIADIEKRLEKLEQKKTSIKEKIMKKFVRNSKEYVKSVILSYIKKYEKVSAIQLKEIIVDEQNFCSKSSFYRLLEEVEQLDEIGVIKRGKEKHFIIKKFSIRDM